MSTLSLDTKRKKLISGFTLIEVLIVAAVLVIIAVAGSGFYTNYNKSIEIDAVTQSLVFNLKQARSNSMIGVDGLKWGVHFVNSTADYYEIFSTPTDYSSAAKSITSKIYLSNGVTFSNPVSDATSDIIFNKISGNAPTSQVGLVYLGNNKIINVSTIGNISVQ